MTNNTIKHLGIVENIQGSHLSVRIVQTSACAACSAKGHCSSADSKDKIIDIIDTAVSIRVSSPAVPLPSDCHNRSSEWIRSSAVSYPPLFYILIAGFPHTGFFA